MSSHSTLLLCTSYEVLNGDIRRAVRYESDYPCSITEEGHPYCIHIPTLQSNGCGRCIFFQIRVRFPSGEPCYTGFREPCYERLRELCYGRLRKPCYGWVELSVDFGGGLIFTRLHFSVLASFVKIITNPDYTWIFHKKLCRTCLRVMVRRRFKRNEPCVVRWFASARHVSGIHWRLLTESTRLAPSTLN